MNENDKKTIIDSYDGDPEDLVFFQNPMDSKGNTTVENTSVDTDTNIDTDTASPVITVHEEQLSDSQRPPEIQAFDINDPHYENYEPDLYYEYGQGMEPEPIGMPNNGKEEGTGLGVASMVTGICSILLGCCGMQYLLSIAALVTGICCLAKKNKSGTAKTFSIVGIVCAALSLLGGVLKAIITLGGTVISSSWSFFMIQ